MLTIYPHDLHQCKIEQVNYTKVITESLIVFKLLPSLFWFALKSWKNYEQFTNILQTILSLSLSECARGTEFFFYFCLIFLIYENSMRSCSWDYRSSWRTRCTMFESALHSLLKMPRAIVLRYSSLLGNLEIHLYFIIGLFCRLSFLKPSPSSSAHNWYYRCN